MMNPKLFFIATIAFLFTLVSVVVTTAQEPQPSDQVSAQAAVGTAFTYQGHLADGGSPADGTYDFQFKLYNAASGGSQVGSTITKGDVAVTGGLFTLELDFGDVFDGTALWLDIGVRLGSSTGAYTSLTPRQSLTPAPFALYALSAGGLSLPFAGNVSSSSPGFWITNNGNGVGVYGVAASGIGGSAYGVYGQSDSASGRGVYGTTTATSGTNYGVYGRSPSTSGRGVYGVAEAGSGTTYGVYGSSASTNGRGVYGIANATSGANYGVYGQSNSTSGWGVYGNATASSGTTYGVYGQSVAPNGVGVLGTHGATSGGGSGVQGQSSASGGRGVLGIASASSGTNYGVFARTNSPDGYAVYATNAASDFALDLVLGGSGSSDNGNLSSAPNLTGSDLVFYSNDEVWFYLDNNDDENGSFQIQVGGGSNNPVFKVDENGNVSADGTYTSPAADFAEMLPATPNLEPGDVLAIGPDGLLTRSAQAYQLNVVGVYSTQPGFLGGAGNEANARGKVPLAVLGVVPVKASAENGLIRPGDLLVASSTPGHAMRCEGMERCFGRTIGKALEGLDEASGVIQMLVILQ